MSKKQSRIDEINSQITTLSMEKSVLECKTKASKGVLKPGDAYVVTYEEDGEDRHCVYYHGVGVVCLNEYSDITSSFCIDMLNEVKGWMLYYGKVKGKKMSLEEAIKYL